MRSLNRSILGDWDVVSCMDLSAVNAVLKKNYDETLKRYKETDREAPPIGPLLADEDGLQSYNNEITHYSNITRRIDPVLHSLPVSAMLLCTTYVLPAPPLPSRPRRVSASSLTKSICAHVQASMVIPCTIESDRVKVWTHEGPDRVKHRHRSGVRHKPRYTKNEGSRRMTRVDGLKSACRMARH